MEKNNAIKKDKTMKKENAMEKNTTTKTGTPPAKAGAPVNEDDIKAAIQAALKDVDGNYKITFGYDDIFCHPIVYTYCDFPTYQNIYRKVFVSHDPPENSAIGYCTTGRIGVKVDGAYNYSVILVWANSSTPFEKSLPTFVHEIVHVAQDIFNDVHVDDADGEAMSIFVEREVKRILKEFFHLPTPRDNRDEVMAKLQALLENPSPKEAGMPSEKADTPACEVDRDDAAAAQTSGEAAGGGISKFTTGYDETFLVPLVYTYSDFASFLNLCRNVLHNDELTAEPSIGYYVYERISTKIDKRSDAKVGLVWVNNSTPLEESLSLFIRGIVLVARDLLKDSEVDDRNGEMIAYTVERETKRIMSEFFHLPVPDNPKTRLLEELGHSFAHKDDAPAPGDEKPISNRVKRNRKTSPRR